MRGFIDENNKEILNKIPQGKRNRYQERKSIFFGVLTFLTIVLAMASIALILSATKYVTVSYVVDNKIEKEIRIERGDTLSLADAPAVQKEGFEFTGWYSDVNATSKYEFGKPVTGDINLYAGLSMHTVTLKIYLNDGSENSYELTGAPLAQRELANLNYINSNAAEDYKLNYQLIGFSGNPTTTHPEYAVEDKVGLYQGVLYAIWEGNPVSVELFSSSALLVNGNPFAGEVLNLSYGDKYVVNTSYFSNIYQENTGARVEGINVTINDAETVLYADGQEIVITSGMKFELAFDDSVNKAVLDFTGVTNTNNATTEYVGIGTTFAFPLVEKTGYVLSGYTIDDSLLVIPLSTEITVTEGVKTYKPHFVAETRIITWSVNGVEYTTELQVGDVLENTNEDPARDSTTQYDYTFKGWSPTEDGEIVELSSVIIAPDSNNTTYKYYAVFNKVTRKYTISFNANSLETAMYPSGAAVQISDIENVNFGTNWIVNLSALNLNTVFEKTTGKQVVGLQINGSGIVYTDGSIIPIEGDIELTLTYSEHADIAIINFNGGSLAGFEGQDNVSYFGVGTTIEFPAISKTGYVLSGYTVGSSQTIVSLDTPIVVVPGVTAYHPYFVGEVRLITWSVNGVEHTTELRVDDVLVNTNEDPTRDSTAQYDYTFKGWSPTEDGEVIELSSVTIAPDSDNTTYKYYAVFNEVAREYTVTWKNDNEILYTANVEYGQIPSYNGSTPEKAEDNYNTYVFEGKWSDIKDGAEIIIGPVTEDATYFALFSSVAKEYSVAFYNQGTEYETAVYGYGEDIALPAAPENYQTESHNYEFAGWKLGENGELITGTWSEKATENNAVYYAVFNEVVREYTITWRNYDETTLNTANVEYGQTPTYTGSTPEKAEDNYNTYVFEGKWSDIKDGAEIVIGPATEDATYFALFTPIAKEYNVTFLSRDVEYETGVYGYGEDIALPTAPENYQTESHNYEFAGWKLGESGDLITAVEWSEKATENNAVYYAVFNEIAREYMVTWKNYDETVLSTNSVEYGQTPTYTGGTPEKAEDNYNTYVFENKWSNIKNGEETTIGPVTEDATYFALFSSVAKEYSVTFYNQGTEYQTAVYAYGEDIVLPTAPENYQTESHNYEFAGWKLGENGELITGAWSEKATESNMVYYAVFNEVAREYTITWKNYDETILNTTNVEYGQIPSYNGSTPEKGEDNYNTYVFEGKWSNVKDGAETTIGPVTEDATYFALFSSVAKEYNITFLSRDIEHETSVYGYGEDIVLPTTPENYQTESHNYEFAGWKLGESGDLITAVEWAEKATENNAVYYAVFNEVAREYTITWKNDNEILYTANVEYGQIPSYNGNTPEKAEDNYNTYVFEGKWTNVKDGAETIIEPVTEDATYFALFSSVAKEYNITFLSRDIEHETSVYGYGEDIVLPTAPENYQTESHNYEFAGWKLGESGELITAVEWSEKATENNAVYYAVFNEIAREYMVTWKNDNEILYTANVEYGQVPVYSGSTPEKAEDNYNTYVFENKWSDVKAGTEIVIGPVTEDATYFALFSSVAKEYNVIFLNQGTEYEAAVYAYGEDIILPTTPENYQTESHNYEFAGWKLGESGELITAVEWSEKATENNMVYYAVFNEVVREYTITWKNYDETILNTTSVEYGQTPVYSDTSGIVRAATAEYTYTFKGWNITDTTNTTEESLNVLPQVTGDATYYAVFNKVVNQYTITFDATSLATASYPDGTSVSVNNITNIDYGTNWEVNLSTLNLDTAFERTSGKQVSGLQINGEGTVFENGTSIAVYENITLTLSYAETANTVVIDYNGGSENGTDLGIGNSVYLGMGTQINASDVKLQYHTLRGYATQNVSYNDVNLGQSIDLYTQEQINEMTVGAGTTTYYAIWEPININFVYDANGGAGTVSGQTSAKYGTNIVLAAKGSVDREYYIFLGWAKTPDATATTHSAGEELILNNFIFDGSYVVSDYEIGNSSASVTLYAVWEQNQTTISFDFGEGTGSPLSRSFEPGESVDVMQLMPDSYVRERHTFVGWSATPDGEVLTGNYVIPTTNTVLYAVWETTNVQISFDANGGQMVGITSPQFVDIGETYTLPTEDQFTFEGATLDYFTANRSIAERDLSYEYRPGEVITDMGKADVVFTAHYSVVIEKVLATLHEEDGLHYVNYGQYPKTYVGQDLNATLNLLYNNGNLQSGLTTTGKTYSSNSSTGSSGGYNGKNSIEYVYQNNRYVRVSTIRHSNAAQYAYSDGSPMGATASIAWFKVEPIKWVILNWDRLPAQVNPNGTGVESVLELNTAELIISGIPFYSSTTENGALWQNSTTRGWLNGINVNNITENGNPDKSAPSGGDFSTQANFISDVFSTAEIDAMEDTRLVNTGIKGLVSEYEMGLLGYETVDKIYVLSHMDTLTINSRYNSVFSDVSSRLKKSTDFAKANNYAITDNHYGTQRLRSTFDTMINGYTDHISANGGISPTGMAANSINTGISPAVSLTLPYEAKPISFDYDIIEESDRRYVEFGEYPKTYVGQSLNAELESLYNEGDLQEGLVETGKTYSSNALSGSLGVYEERANIEYMYQNNRYVRAIVTRAQSSSYYVYSDTTLIPETGAVSWFKVEPIKWMIINWDSLPTEINPDGTGAASKIELYAADIIMGGIPFYPDSTTDSGMWQNSTMRAWLNGINVNSITENGFPDRNKPDGGDFTDKGNFISEAFTSEEREKLAQKILANNYPNLSGGLGVSKGYIAYETSDRIYLPTYYDLFVSTSMYYNLFGTVQNRQSSLTDYARAHNVYMYANVNSPYWLRTGYTNSSPYIINNNGAYDWGSANSLIKGSIRPVIVLDLR